jgi:hypothetical protein
MFLPLRHPERAIPRVTHYRSTGLVSCLQIIERRGLRARYDAGLSAEERRAVAEVLPATWTEAHVALAHFRAIDSLGFTTGELLELGMAAGERVLAYQTSTILRMTREIGITPWALFPHGHRLWDRMCRGGDLSIERVGPKEALVALHGLPSVGSLYFRTMIRGVFEAGLSLWCTKCYVTEVSAKGTTLVLREAWV